MTTRTSRAAANFNQGYSNAYRNRLAKNKQEEERRKQEALESAAGIPMPDQIRTTGAGTVTGTGSGTTEPKVTQYTSGVPEGATPGFNPNSNVKKLEGYSAPIEEAVPTVVTAAPQDVTTKALEKTSDVPEVTAADWQDTINRRAQAYAAAGLTDAYERATNEVEKHKMSMFNSSMQSAAMRFDADKTGAAAELKKAFQYIGDGQQVDIVVGQDGELVVNRTDETTGEVTEMPLGFDNAEDLMRYGQMLTNPEEWMKHQVDARAVIEDTRRFDEEFKQRQQEHLDDLEAKYKGYEKDLAIAEMNNLYDVQIQELKNNGVDTDNYLNWVDDYAKLVHDPNTLSSVVGITPIKEAYEDNPRELTLIRTNGGDYGKYNANIQPEEAIRMADIVHRGEPGKDFIIREHNGTGARIVIDTMRGVTFNLPPSGFADYERRMQQGGGQP